MTAVYALALLTGIILVLGWVAAVAVSEMVAGWSHLDPERRFGRRGRLVVAGLAGFGLGGMLASYAGWPLAVGVGVAAWFLAASLDFEET